MPYFSWKGVTLHAHTKKGISFAYSVKELDGQLFSQGIALTQVKEKKFFIHREMNLTQKIHYFTQCRMLISSGMRIPETFIALAEQTARTSFGLITAGVARQVKHGNSLGVAFSEFSSFSHILIIQMIRVGEESGNMVGALTVLVKYLEAIADFKKRIRSVVVAPLITALFFVAVAGIILVAIIPQLITIFGSLGKQVPENITILLAISNFIQSWKMLMALIVFAVIFIGVVKLFQRKVIKQWFDTVIVRIPFIARIYSAHILSIYFKSLSLLLESGTSLVDALGITKESILNSSLKQEFHYVYHSVKAGEPLAQALKEHTSSIETQMNALIQVGQETGMVKEVAEKVAHFYQERLIADLAKIQALFGPFLLVVLGLLIGALILALYAPITTIGFVM